MHASLREKLQKDWPKIQFTGAVKRIIPHLDNVRIAIIPEQAGGGFKLKSLEYVFQRLPIFALEHALVDLPLENRSSVMLYSDIQQLVMGIVNHIDDTDLLESMQRQAFDACESRRHVNSMRLVLENIYFK